MLNTFIKKRAEKNCFYLQSEKDLLWRFAGCDQNLKHLQ